MSYKPPPTWIKNVLAVVLVIADAHQVLSNFYGKQKRRLQKVLGRPGSTAQPQSAAKLDHLLSGKSFESDRTTEPGPYWEDSLRT
jgi:hypothetical protein